MAQFNNRIRQIIILILILLMGFLIIKELYILIPGFLGAVTLYILGRERYAHLVYVKKWKPSWTALLYIMVSLVVISALMYFTIKVMLPKFNIVFSHPQELMQGLHKLSEQVNATTGVDLFSEANLAKLQQGLGNFIPTFLNSTLNILGNVVMMFFVLYFMLVHGKEMEAAVTTFIPLHPESITKLAKETKNMVRANAIGIPLISLVQGLFATAGYWIFGLSEFGLWGFLTGVFAFFPLVGTMLIWLPLVIYQFSQGATVQGGGLLIYSLLVTGNVDYLARITLMKKIGDVHPLITILGVIVGLGLFGFMGFIFGPLLLSYLILMIKIYTSEFVDHSKL
jgi:predicted PurR-regulated permease PerM